MEKRRQEATSAALQPIALSSTCEDDDVAEKLNDHSHPCRCRRPAGRHPWRPAQQVLSFLSMQETPAAPLRHGGLKPCAIHVLPETWMQLLAVKGDTPHRICIDGQDKRGNTAAESLELLHRVANVAGQAVQLDEAAAIAAFYSSKEAWVTDRKEERRKGVAAMRQHSAVS